MSECSLACVFPRDMFADTRVFDLTNRHMGIMDDTPGFSMEERDPNNINLHLQVRIHTAVCLFVFPDGCRHQRLFSCGLGLGKTLPASN